MNNLERVKKIFPLAIALFFLVIFSIKYVSGLQFLAGISVLVLLFLLFEPIYPFCLLVLFFWVPRGFNYLFLKDVFVCAPIAEVFSYIFLIVYIFTGALKKKDSLNSILKTPLLLPIFLFILGDLVSYLFGEAPDRLLAYVLFRQNSFYALVLYILSASIVKNVHDAKKISASLIVGNLLLTIFIFYSYYFGTNVMEVYAPDRLGGQFSLFGKNSIAISCIMAGNQMATIIPFAAALAFLGWRFYHKILGILALFLFSLVLISSGTRGAWLACTVGIAPVIILSLSYRRSSILSKILSFIFMILALIAILFLSRWYLQFNEYLTNRFEGLKYVLKDASLIDRMEIWVYSFKAFLGHPLGMGFRDEYPLGFLTKYPHSLYVGLLLSSGLLGTVGFFWFLISWFRRVLRCLKVAGRDEQIIFTAAMGSSLAFLIYGIFEHPAYSPTIIIPTIWIIWGTTMGLVRRGG